MQENTSICTMSSVVILVCLLAAFAFHSFRNFRRFPARHSVELVATFKEAESWHAFDSTLLSHVLAFVDINFEIFEARRSFSGAHLAICNRAIFAWTTPSCVEIDDAQMVLGDHL